MTYPPQIPVPPPAGGASAQPGGASKVPPPSPTGQAVPQPPPGAPGGLPQPDAVPRPAEPNPPTRRGATPRSGHTPTRLPSGSASSVAPSRFAPSEQRGSGDARPSARPAAPNTAPVAPGQFTPQFQSFVRSAPTMPGPGAAQYPTAAPRVAQVWVMPAPKKKPLPIVEAVLIGAGSAMMFLVVLGVFIGAGLENSAFLSLMSMIPLSVVTCFLLFVDRFEPEPWWTKVAAFLWGGGVAVFFAGMSNGVAEMIFSEVTNNAEAGDAFAVVVGAPLGEEFLKALGVGVIVMMRRNSISSPLDGFLYAGLSAMGFLVVEDLSYFVDSVNDGAFWQTFFVRVVMGVFGHVMYTSLTGWAIGWAVTRTPSPGIGFGAVLLGYLLGVTLHGVWNGSGYVVSSIEMWFVLYVVVQIPLFIGWLCFVAFSMKRERRDAAAGLMPYVKQGWIIPSEVQMVCDPSSRRAALAWASRGGPAAKKAMKQFIYALATVGLNQVVMNVRGPETKRIEATREIVQEATEQRAIFMRLTGVQGV